MSERANLLSDLPSLGRLSRRDQRTLDRRLRALVGQALDRDATSLAANLLRASYELDVGESRWAA